MEHSAWGIREDADGNITVGSGDDALIHIAGPTTEAERRLDASVLGVAGIVGHDTADRLTAADGGSLLAGAGGIAFSHRHHNLPAARFLQRRHLIPQAGEVDVDAAGFRVLAADCDFGRGCVDDLAFHGVEREILRGHADAQAGRDVAGLAG